jgi:hypothetical protein
MELSGSAIFWSTLLQLLLWSVVGCGAWLTNVLFPGNPRLYIVSYLLVQLTLLSGTRSSFARWLAWRVTTGLRSDKLIRPAMATIMYITIVIWVVIDVDPGTWLLPGAFGHHRWSREAQLRAPFDLWIQLPLGLAYLWYIGRRGWMWYRGDQLQWLFWLNQLVQTAAAIVALWQVAPVVVASLLVAWTGLCRVGSVRTTDASSGIVTYSAITSLSNGGPI